MVIITQFLEKGLSKILMEEDLADTPKINGKRKLPLESYDQSSPRLLTGFNNWNLEMTIKFRDSDTDQVIATKTRLWLLIHFVSLTIKIF